MAESMDDQNSANGLESVSLLATTMNLDVDLSLDDITVWIYGFDE